MPAGWEFKNFTSSSLFPLNSTPYRMVAGYMCSPLPYEYSVDWLQLTIRQERQCTVHCPFEYPICPCCCCKVVIQQPIWFIWDWKHGQFESTLLYHPHLFTIYPSSCHFFHVSSSSSYVWQQSANALEQFSILKNPIFHRSIADFPHSTVEMWKPGCTWNDRIHMKVGKQIDYVFLSFPPPRQLVYNLDSSAI